MTSKRMKTTYEFKQVKKGINKEENDPKME